jgi:hypothetical protein
MDLGEGPYHIGTESAQLGRVDDVLLRRKEHISKDGPWILNANVEFYMPAMD